MEIGGKCRLVCPKAKRTDAVNGGEAAMYFTSGKSRAFEALMQGKPGFDRFENGGCAEHENCNACRFYRPNWKYRFCVYEECPYEPGKLTAIPCSKAE